MREPLRDPSEYDQKNRPHDHELKHAYDFQNGIASSDKDANGVEYDEYRAVQFENLIRKEEKRPMRTTYGKHPVPQKYLNQQ